MTTKCPRCNALLETDMEGVRFGTKKSWRNEPGFGQEVDLVDDSTSAYFHPWCPPEDAGYVEAEVPPQP